MEILFGTFNPGKLLEIQALLGNTYKIRHCGEFEGLQEVAETGITLEENARMKALAYHMATGVPCFADDTGLQVNALNGAPGVNTAYYAGPEKDSSANMTKLLQNMAGKANRMAQFKTVIAFVASPKTEVIVEGILNGLITRAPRGNNGFGYDPIFEIPQLGLTLAELTLEQKNSYSHRAIALRKLIEYLTSVY